MKTKDIFGINHDQMSNLPFTWLNYFVSFLSWFNMSPPTMFLIENDDLEYRINQLKKELIQVALKTGLNSPDTIYCSQKLDDLISIYQRDLQVNSAQASFKSLG